MDREASDEVKGIVGVTRLVSFKVRKWNFSSGTTSTCRVWSLVNPMNAMLPLVVSLLEVSSILEAWSVPSVSPFGRLAWHSSAITGEPPENKQCQRWWNPISWVCGGYGTCSRFQPRWVSIAGCEWHPIQCSCSSTYRDQHPSVLETWSGWNPWCEIPAKGRFAWGCAVWTASNVLGR